LLEGKRIEGFKVTKEIRKNIKFALKRGDNIEVIRKGLLIEASKDHKILIKNN
jgi:hypothetical protein